MEQLINGLNRGIPLYIFIMLLIDKKDIYLIRATIKVRDCSPIIMARVNCYSLGFFT